MGGGGERGGVGSGGWSCWGCVRVDVNEELKFLGKFKKKYCIGGGGGGSGGGVRWGGRFGGGGGVQGGCEPNVGGRG